MSVSSIVHSYWSIARTLGGDSLTNRCALFVRLMLVPIRKRVFGRKLIPLSIAYAGKRMNIFVRDGADIAVLREVFVDEEYAVNLPVAPRHIVDIGGHAGFASLYFAARYSEACIRIYEPDPDNFAALSANVAHMPRIEARQLAVSDTSGSMHFYTNESSISSSLTKRSGATEIDVEATTLDAILEGHPADLLKFDAEGAEYRLFFASRMRLSCPFLIGELHDDLMGHTREEFFALFTDHDRTEKPLGDRRAIISLTAR